MNDDKTLEYYDSHAKQYIANSLNLEFSDMQDAFLGYLPQGARILDFGCGSGRDSLYFLDKGYDVVPMDGSSYMCRLASLNLPVPVVCQEFERLDAQDEYDGIWACASILHVRPEALEDIVLPKMMSALKPGGILYASFKKGDFRGERDGRWFTDFTEDQARELFSKFPGLSVEDMFVSKDVRADRDGLEWVNIFIRKNS